uniref:CRAL-TRIO domain-containing protein n=1 Tax=Strigamia maritima TaxID=126957 RepID=T1IZ80_STRMM
MKILSLEPISPTLQSKQEISNDVSCDATQSSKNRSMLKCFKLSAKDLIRSTSTLSRSSDIYVSKSRTIQTTCNNGSKIPISRKGIQAYERRFPTCKMIPVFVGSEIISEVTSEDRAVTKVERRCKLNVEAPYLLKKIVGVDFVYFIQKNSLDRRARQLKIDAQNESFATRIVVYESCVYSVHPENSSWTCFEQTASLDVKSFFGFENAVEKLAMKQYSQNIQKGKEVIEYYINELLSEGITYIPPFQQEELPPAIHVVGESHVNSTLSSTVVSGSAPNSLLEATISEDDNFKLDSDYIERCLGKLTPLQESQLVQLRRLVSQAQKGKAPSDAMLLRFLRAADFNLDKARDVLCHSLSWRKKYQVDRILNTYDAPRVVKDYFPGGWHQYDKAGRPLFILRLGQMDVKGIVRSVGEDGLLKLTLRICEEGLRKTEKATRIKGKPINTWTCLVDLDGLNMRHLWRPGIRALLRVIEIVEANYPETMDRVLIIRAPRVFPILWTIISKFIDENTRQKFLFYGGKDYQEPGGLVDYVDEKFIPDFLGGQAKTIFPEGGLVPKSLYLPLEEYERSEEKCGESIYNCITLGRGQVHEVVLHDLEKGSVICWDFDILKQDVVFMLLRTHKQILDDVSAASNCTSILDHQTHFDKNWKENIDYFKAEKLTCHDGESIQGSHVTSHSETYILQWKLHESTHHTFDIIDSITTHHKARIMYYYEVLKSHEFRGSMTSLQSCQSGFSSLSVGTSSSNQSAISSCPSR